VADMNETEGNATVRLIKESGGKAVFVKTNISKEADCQQMIKIAEKEFGKVNILFNNAGVMLNEDDNAMTTDEKTWDTTFNINVKGVFFWV